MENNVEIILIGSINKLLEIYGAATDDDCINVYKDINGLLAISHNYDELLHIMKTTDEFNDREYVLKELNEEKENKYLTLYNITDLETIKNIIYEEFKDLPTTKYPREE